MKIEINQKDFLDLVHWSRRYCHNRLTGAPSEFNRIYEELQLKYPEIMASEQSDIHVVDSFPLARYGSND